MTIPARYENGVFEPLAELTIEEGTVVEVYVPKREDPDHGPSAISSSRACRRTATTSPMV